MTLTKEEEASAVKALSDMLAGSLAGLVWALILVGPMVYFGAFRIWSLLCFTLVPAGAVVGMYAGKTGTIVIGFFVSCQLLAVVTLAYWPRIFA